MQWCKYLRYLYMVSRGKHSLHCIIEHEYMARGSLHFLRIQLQQNMTGFGFSWVCTIRGRSHIAPKNAWKTLGALLSPFFQCARAVALRRRLSLLSNHQLRSPLQEGKFVTWPVVRLHILKSWDVFISMRRRRAWKKRARRFHYERAYRASTFEITNLSAQKTRYVSGPLKRLSCPSASFLLFLAPVSSSAHYLLQFFHGAIFFYSVTNVF